MMQPIANLPVTIFKFAMSPFAEWQQLAWAGGIDYHPVRTAAERSGARGFREE
nr:phosphate ABC transporter permease [Raoultella sp. NCTC 9187]